MRILVSGSTRTVGQLDASWPGHLGHLLTPSNRNAVASLLKTGLYWAADNGAYSGFAPERYTAMLRRIAGKPRLLWVVAPDVVGDARATLALFPWWSLEIRSLGLPVAFVLQDGQEDIELPEADCYFIGGSTAFKLCDAAADLVREGIRRRALIHMGRVNSLRRLAYAYRIGCDSVDGSGYSRFAAVATSKGRRDMLLERHLEVMRGLENQPTLY